MTIKDKVTQAFQDRCLALRPILGKQADDIWTAYLYQDEAGKKELEQQLELLVNSILNTDVQNKTPTFLPPSREAAKGEFLLGDVFYNGKAVCPFGLRSPEVFQHTAIFGRSGAGKSNLGFLFAKSLAQNNIPFLVFDWKRGWRDLLGLKEFQDLQVFTIGRDEVVPFRWNPLVPPRNVSPQVYLQHIAYLIAHAFYLGDGCIYVLTGVLDSLYRQFGIYNENARRFPTFKDVLHRLETMAKTTRGRESLWLASTLRAVSSLCFEPISSVINTSSGAGLELLFDKQVVFELESLSEAHKVFFVECVLNSIYNHAATQGERERLRSVLIIEEAHQVLRRRTRNSVIGEGITDSLFRMIREYGVGILMLDQTPSETSRVALANTYCTIAMNAKEYADVATLSNAMLLSAEQKDGLGNLPVGQAIVKLQSPRTPEACMIQIPLVPVKKGSVTDSRLREIMREHIASIENNKDPMADLSPDEINFLEDIALVPCSTVTARYKRLGLSGRQGDKIKHSLLDKRLVSEDERITPNGRTKVIRLTEETKKVLESYVPADD